MGEESTGIEFWLVTKYEIFPACLRQGAPHKHQRRSFGGEGGSGIK